MPGMIPLPAAAMRLSLPYRAAYDAVLRGELGAAERRGGRIFVPSEAVEQAVKERSRPSTKSLAQ